jgi:hypothetical protein
LAETSAGKLADSYFKNALIGAKQQQQKHQRTTAISAEAC